MRKILSLSAIFIALSVFSSQINASENDSEGFGSKIVNMWSKFKEFVVEHLVPDFDEDNLENPQKAPAVRPEGTEALFSDAKVPAAPLNPNDAASAMDKMILGDLLPDSQNNAAMVATPTPSAVIEELKTEDRQEDLQEGEDLYPAIRQEGEDASHVPAIPYNEKGVQVIDMGPEPMPTEGSVLGKMADPHAHNPKIEHLQQANPPA